MVTTRKKNGGRHRGPLPGAEATRNLFFLKEIQTASQGVLAKVVKIYLGVNNGSCQVCAGKFLTEGAAFEVAKNELRKAVENCEGDLEFSPRHISVTTKDLIVIGYYEK